MLNRNSAKKGNHNLGGSIKEHSAARFHPVKLADGGDALERYGDTIPMIDLRSRTQDQSAQNIASQRASASADMADPNVTSGAPSAMTAAPMPPSPEPAAPSPSPGQADMDTASAQAGAAAGAKAALADKAKAAARKESIQQSAADAGGWGGERARAKQTQKVVAEKAAAAAEPATPAATTEEPKATSRGRLTLRGSDAGKKLASAGGRGGRG